MLFLKRFFEDERGNFATVFGVLAAAFSVAIAMAVQVSGLSHARSNLQEVVDAAVIAAAKEAQLANFNRTVAQGVAEDFVLSNMSGRMHEAKVETVVKSGLRSYATQFARTEITVNAAVKVAHPLWSTGGNTVTMQASATARIRSAGKMCVIILEDSEKGALSLTTRARMTATDCAVYSNSVSRAGIVTANHVRLDSRFVCTAGGFKGRLNHYTTKPLTDCPQTPDPLAGRKPPAVGACLAATSGKKIVSGTHLLKPGTYCGGLTIGGGAKVTLAPGEYVFKDGPLVVAGSATLRGEYVGLYFTGKDAVAEFGIRTVIDIGAPKSGPMSGILIYQDRGNSRDDLFSIKSSNARNLLGTIYIPRGGLFIDAAGKVADQSAYTTIVARTMKLSNGPNLMLNTDYDGTDVPVPMGLGPVKGDIWLAR
jgi:Flp pilus assembly protein TadG